MPTSRPATQLALPIARLQWDRLCGQLRIAPALEGEGGSLTSRWRGKRLIAWSVSPAADGGWWWEATSQNYSSGMRAWRETRDEAIEAAHQRLLEFERRRR